MGEGRGSMGRLAKIENSRDLFSGIYDGKRVLVTGHTGFKGSWLSLWLHQLGAEVAGFSKYYPSDPCHFEVIGLKNHVRHCEGDICDFNSLKKVFNDFKPQIVFHLAAQPIVRESYNEPKLTFDTNLGGTVNLLECLKQSSSVEAAVMITSDKCYENVGWDWGYRETDRLGGEDPYSASKACAEIAFQSYFKSFFDQNENAPSIATARAGNVIGGGDWAKDRIIPDCMRAWSRGEVAMIRSPEATRPWQHVLEPLSGYLWLGACLLNHRRGIDPWAVDSIHGQSFNFGPDSTIVQSVREVVKALLKYWPASNWKEVMGEPNKKEASLLKLSCDKAFRRLSWQPVLGFDETISLTAEWYKQYYLNPQQSYERTCLNIDQYVDYACEKGLLWTAARIGKKENILK